MNQKKSGAWSTFLLILILLALYVLSNHLYKKKLERLERENGEIAHDQDKEDS